MFIYEPGTEKCRGFGYVTYSMEEDAQRALKEIKEYDGRKLSLSVARKKIKDKRKTGVYKSQKLATWRALTLCLLDNLHVFHLAPKEPTAAPKENEQKSKGFRKSSLKARLIIRNLSFKVQYAHMVVKLRN